MYSNSTLHSMAIVPLATEDSVTDDRAKSFLQIIRRSQRGRLKIYLGYGPGVGKTYQMLQEAHRLKKEGVDVAIGVVETHGRVDTANLVTGLEIIPRRCLEYKGIIVDDMDVDAIINRRPDVVLVDELAHTNVPTSRNNKRYEDVNEILGAGIHVIATLNVQHLESLYNTVERLIGVKVRERIPDTVLAEADQIVNVDLTPEDLQTRLRDGKVYPEERVDPALENFFTHGNLEQLRELTMREIAAQIDFKRREVLDDTDKIAPDQVMVCLASKGPNSAHLLRFASRLAGRLNRNWYAVYVQTSKEDPTKIDATTQRLLADSLTLANQLGATVFTFKGEDIVATILKFAKEYRVGNIVIGRPNPKPKWQQWLRRQSIAEQLVLKATGYTVVVVDTEAPTVERKVTAIESRKTASPLPAAETITALLTEPRIALFKTPVTKDEVLAQLVRCIVIDTKSEALSDATTILNAILARERQGSTFLNESIAIPHARIAGLPAPRAALAITKQGVSDVTNERPTEAVFLLLLPTTGPQASLSVLTKVIRLFQDLNVRRSLHEAQNAAEVLHVIHRSEMT